MRGNQTRYRVIIFLITALWVSGCTSFSKKFVRKKKAQKKETVYFELKEYPLAAPQDLYDDYYLFAVGWFDEFLDCLKDGNNFKRQKSTFNEVIANVTRLRQLLNEEGQKAMEPLYNELIAIQNELSFQMTAVERKILYQKVATLKRQFANEYKYSKVTTWLESE